MRSQATHLLQLTLKLEEERGLVGLKARAAVVILPQKCIDGWALGLVCGGRPLEGRLGRSEDVSGAN